MLDLQSPIKLGNKTAAPANVTIVPNTTRPTAGSFSRLYNEWGSIWIYAKPGKMYANGIAASSPWCVWKRNNAKILLTKLFFVINFETASYI